MSLLLRGINIKKEFKDRVILEDVNFHVEDLDRIAIVGNNGAGKTTLANIITGELKQDEGQLIWHKKNVKIGYLHQSTYYSQNEFNNMLISKDKINISNFIYASKKLGTDKIQEFNNIRLNNLSGGEKTKFALAKIWSEKPGLLILDEPTNHMDYEGVNWLITNLSRFQGTVIIISHDRYFMDEICNRVIEIDNGRAYSYKGNYSDYYNEKRKRYETRLHQYEVQEKTKENINREINRLKYWAEKGHRDSTKTNGQKEKFGLKEKRRAKVKKRDKQVKSKIKMLEKIKFEGIEKPKEEQKITFQFINNSKSSKVLEAKDIVKSFDGEFLFEESSFYIKSGEKIGVYGKNGCGKTTLIKAILNELKLEQGKIYVSPSTKIAYLSQDVGEMNIDKTVLQFFDIDDFTKRGILQTLLANMGFTNKMINTKIKHLSVGEKTRVKIAHMIMMENNVLILDEPTNHLDLHSREMLEKTLANYLGTIIIVSHDRYLLEKLCNKVLVFEDGKINRKEESFTDYMTKKEKKTNSINMPEDKNYKEKLIIINNRIAKVLGELSISSEQEERYMSLDREFQDLIKQKNDLAILNN
ncbi:ABC transporter ATP-binding protein [Vallitalea longa]|uniref:ABC transporter ATP-binding protein n=1 Tax=Vallitalea longa TaxID=2936439 RepID=A0A9W6DE70_9FIRM|nr:ABC-F type ribosomal protection protein [Vallitalea longa]GKX29836.1 ABC transporter ATP-binding protein [Vallitalea longa]